MTSRLPAEALRASNTFAMRWKPDLTVATIVARQGLFLMVEEHIGGRLVLNQPAGHVEDGESILDAGIRETLEETAWHVQPRHLVGTYLWRNPRNGNTTLRFALAADALHEQTGRQLDRGIVAAHWLSREQLVAHSHRLRSELVLRCIDDWLAGQRFDLSALATVGAGNSADLPRAPTLRGIGS
jgi:8-oxo-dGTP pyrophosphatase MutT (NUDIX family)